MSLKYLTLEVPRNSLKEVKRWYEEVLGMAVMKQTANAVSLGFENQSGSAWVELLAVSEKSGERREEKTSEDVYWKIGIGLADVSAARDRLRERGVAVTEAKQFRQDTITVFIVQGWEKEWSLGCVNSRPVARGSREAGFTQPSTKVNCLLNVPLPACIIRLKSLSAF